MSAETIAQQFKPVFTDIRDRSTIAERFIDRDLYRVYMATLWSNVVMSPDDAGLLEEDLEDLHDDEPVGARSRRRDGGRGETGRSRRE